MSGFAVLGIGSLTSIDRETDWIRKHGDFARTESKPRCSFGGDGLLEFEAAVIRLGSTLVGRSRRAFDYGCAIFRSESARRLSGISLSLPGAHCLFLSDARARCAWITVRPPAYFTNLVVHHRLESLSACRLHAKLRGEDFR